MEADRHIDEAILSLLKERGPGKSACPSEVARRLQPEGWRGCMPAVRERAAALAGAGKLRITRGDKTLEPEALSGGPVRLRLPG